MTEGSKSDTQKFTGVYPVSGQSDSPAFGQTSASNLGSLPARPDSQDTTFVAPQTGLKKTFLPGDVIDNTYQLVKLLGRGGMGIVFSCRHNTLNQDYALKLLSDSQLNAEVWARFRDEAKALAKLNHPGIVGIYNMGLDSGLFPYYVMDLLSGETIDVLVEKSGPLPYRQTVDIFIQIADALNSAHGQGIIHRDIKPSNLMLLRDGGGKISSVKIVDFGIARLTKHELSAQSQTATGTVFGTPYYMSPEQCQGLKVDERSDIYSLGCTIFEALTGRPPFRGENAFHTFLMHQNEPAPSLASVARGREFPESLELAVQKMLAKKPVKRYQTMLQLQHDLERIKAGKAIMGQGTTTQAATAIAKHSSRPEQDADDGEKEENSNGRRDRNPPLSQRQGTTASPPKISSLVKTLTTTGLIAVVACGAAIYRTTTAPRLDLCRTAKLPSKTGALPKPAPHPDDATATGAKSPPRKSAELAGVEGQLGFGSAAQEDNMYDVAFSKKIAGPFAQLQDDVDKFRPKLRAYVEKCKRNHTMFRQAGSIPGFHFPTDISIGAISIGGQKPLLATGFIPAKPNQAACLYLESATKVCPQLLDLFGEDDLTGLQFVWPNKMDALVRAQKFRNLKELSLFNPLIKAPVVAPDWELTPMNDRILAYINERFPNITALGVGGEDVSSEAIAHMPLLPKLKKLQLLNVHDIDPILTALTHSDNINELWLIGESVGPQQLEIIGRIRNLHTLKITRNAIDTKWAPYFAHMLKLDRLFLDRSFSREKRLEFEKQIPHIRCQYENRDDYSYWVLLPGAHPKNGAVNFFGGE